MTDLEHMLKRQGQWQKSRQSLTWPEKIRLAERVRESVRQLRAQGTDSTAPASDRLTPVQER